MGSDLNPYREDMNTETPSCKIESNTYRMYFPDQLLGSRHNSIFLTRKYINKCIQGNCLSLKQNMEFINAIET